MAPAETMMLLDKSCWLFENSWGKHINRNHSFQKYNITELYLWTTTWASGHLQSTANHNFRDLHKSLTHRCEADASREVLNSRASGLPVKKKTKFFSTSLCKTNLDSEYLNMASNFSLAYNQHYFPLIPLQAPWLSKICLNTRRMQQIQEFSFILWSKICKLLKYFFLFCQLQIKENYVRRSGTVFWDLLPLCCILQLFCLVLCFLLTVSEIQISLKSMMNFAFIFLSRPHKKLEM